MELKSTMAEALNRMAKIEKAVTLPKALTLPYIFSDRSASIFQEPEWIKQLAIISNANPLKHGLGSNYLSIAEKNTWASGMGESMKWAKEMQETNGWIRELQDTFAYIKSLNTDIYNHRIGLEPAITAMQEAQQRYTSFAMPYAEVIDIYRKSNFLRVQNSFIGLAAHVPSINPDLWSSRFTDILYNDLLAAIHKEDWSAVVESEENIEIVVSKLEVLKSNDGTIPEKIIDFFNAISKSLSGPGLALLLFFLSPAYNNIWNKHFGNDSGTNPIEIEKNSRMIQDNVTAPASECHQSFQSADTTKVKLKSKG
jgi:hypothetical protein